MSCLELAYITLRNLWMLDCSRIFWMNPEEAFLMPPNSRLRDEETTAGCWSLWEERHEQHRARRIPLRILSPGVQEWGARWQQFSISEVQSLISHHSQRAVLHKAAWFGHLRDSAVSFIVLSHGHLKVFSQNKIKHNATPEMIFNRMCSDREIPTYLLMLGFLCTEVVNLAQGINRWVSVQLEAGGGFCATHS